MKLLLLVTVVFALTVPCAPEVLAQELTQPTQSASAGARLFGARGCIKCHAINGIGGKIGPDFGHFPHPRSFYDFATSMWNHLPVMAERMKEMGMDEPRLDAQDIGNVIAFLFTINYFDPPGDASRGKAVFRQKRCIVCHQVAGVGGVVGPNLDFVSQYGSPIQVATAMWNHGPAMSEAMKAKGIERPAFTATDLIDLIAYLELAAPGIDRGPMYVLPGRADRGRQLFEEKLCVRCHGSKGQGGAVGPPLAERAVYESLTGFAAAMWNKAPAMTGAMRRLGIPVPNLLPEEMADLVAYLYSVEYFAVPGNAVRGRQLVSRKGCLSCHSLNGKGGSSASDLGSDWNDGSRARIVSALWNHISIEKSAKERQTWPVLRPGEMADLVTFLAGTQRIR
ncbi:MAG: c-type cytochrome [Gemmatimonadales bacterium]